MTAPIIATHKLTKKFGVTTSVMGVNLTLQPGQTLGFIGPNGAGKTTTIRMLLGEIRATSGKATIFGLDCFTNAPAIHARLGYLTGDMQLDRALTAGQYLRYAAHLRGRGADQIAPLAERLQAELKKPITALSRGNRQKIGLIAALMHRPELLILDEPSSGFDPLVQQEFAALMREHAERGGAALISSHVLSEVQHLCDQVGFIRAGELIKVEGMGAVERDLFKRVRLTTQTPLPLSALHSLTGVKNVVQRGGTLTFEYRGAAAPLLKILAHHAIDDVVIEEADLESLFLKYYEKDHA